MKLDYKEFEPLFGLWAEKFKPFIESEGMFNIYQKLKNEKEQIVPNSSNVFRSFSTSNPNTVRSIWYLMDPYPRRYKNKMNQATGIAMDCSNSPDGEIQPSLKEFYKGMEKDLGEKVMHSPDLSYLQEQGVMLLNTELTCLLNKTGSHEGLWEPFQKYFLEEVMRGTSNIIYVLCGKDSKRMLKYINPLGNHIFYLDHPAHAAHTHTDWNCKKIFTTINNILKANGQYSITWDKQIHDTELPF